MDRHLSALVLLHEGLGLVVGVVARIALGGDRQIDHRLAQRQLAFGAAQALVGQGGVVGDLHGARIGQPYVFPGHEYRYAHDEPNAYAAGETYLPDGIAEPRWYQPVPRGLESKIAEKLTLLRKWDDEAGGK